MNKVVVGLVVLFVVLSLIIGCSKGNILTGSSSSVPGVRQPSFSDDENQTKPAQPLGDNLLTSHIRRP